MCWYLVFGQCQYSYRYLLSQYQNLGMKEYYWYLQRKCTAITVFPSKSATLKKKENTFDGQENVPKTFYKDVQITILYKHNQCCTQVHSLLRLFRSNIKSLLPNSLIMFYQAIKFNSILGREYTCMLCRSNCACSTERK